MVATDFSERQIDEQQQPRMPCWLKHEQGEDC
jgi:hypothetical protein